MTLLLDLNVLLALAWSSHEHHDAAHAWFKTIERWATCPFTQVGFIRLSANPAVVDPPASPQAAAALLRGMTKQRRHRFFVDDMQVKDATAWPYAWARGHRQVTDAHLVRLALRHRGKLATFERSLLHAAGSEAVEWISGAGKGAG